MIFGSNRKRGLFDPPQTWNTPGIGDDVNRRKAGLLGMADQTPDYQQPEKPVGFWQGGEKFGLKDGAAALLAAIGDAFASQSGMQTGAVGNLVGGRSDAMERVRKAQAQKQEIASARQRYQAAGLNPAQADLAANGDAKFSDVYQKPGSPHRWEDNAGNQWEMGPDGQPRRFFTDEIPKMYIQGDQAVQITNPYVQRPSSNGAELPAGYSVRRGGPTQPASGGFPRRRY